MLTIFEIYDVQKICEFQKVLFFFNENCKIKKLKMRKFKKTQRSTEMKLRLLRIYII